jgi:ligand-binding sensor domain-containing protein/two-component sensor histidine kinase
MKLLRLFILCCAVIHSCAAQTFRLPFINFDDRDGLPDRFVYTAAQDKQGFLWFGAGSGLYRYDGKSFQNKKSPVDVPGHQISNILQRVYADNQKGLIWLASLNALQTYNPATGKFRSFDYTKKAIKELLEHGIRSFFRDSQGQFWVTSEQSYWYLFDERQQSIIRYTTPKQTGHTPEQIVKIIETPGGKLWAVSESGLYAFTPSSTLTKAYIAPTEASATFTDGYYDKKRNCIWLSAGNGGIAQFYLATYHFRFFPVINSNNPKLRSFTGTICPKNDNEIWLGAGTLGIFNCRTHTTEFVQSEYRDEFSFKNNLILQLNNDLEGNLWICSSNGLSQLPWQNNQIKNISLTHPVFGYTIEPKSVVAYNNQLFIANNTSNGLLWWNPEKKQLTVIPNPLHKSTDLKGIQCIHQTRQGAIYAGDELGLYRFFPVTKQLTPLTVKDQHGKLLKAIYKIISDKQGNLYLYSPGNGFYFYNAQNNTAQQYNLWDIDRSVLSLQNENTLVPSFIDRKNAIWFTHNNGVYCLNKETGVFHHYATGKALNNGVSLTVSYDIREDKNGHFWITTVDNGLFELYFRNGKEQLFNYPKNEITGIPSDYCYRLVTDQKGYLWIGTLSGLVRFDPKTKKAATVLTRQNGLPNTNIDVALSMTENGQLIISNYGILSILDTRNYRTNQLCSPIIFTSVKILDNERISGKDRLKQLELTENENFITFHWTVPVYNNSNQFRYAYQLAGIDQKWTYTSSNTISYSGLPFGTHTFRIIAINNDGRTSPVRTITIVVHPPFWKTIWFGVALVVITITGIWLAFRMKVRQLKKEEKLKTTYAQQIADIELKALRAQMNPHFIFNSLNSIQKFILANDARTASQYLTKFARLIRMILDNSDQNNTTLAQELELLNTYVEIEALRFDNRFDYRVNIAPELQPESCLIPPMLIQPFLENAIWHGMLHSDNRGLLTLDIRKYGESEILITIEDNGIGRERSLQLHNKQLHKNKSFGVSISRDRISILNQQTNTRAELRIIDLKDESGKPAGTRVELILPVLTEITDI